ncbi:MAG: NADH-quinone oxidoreductase subunit [Thermoleophilaceae bacterium]|nr:NADH-quinone oxidoreductase subunit [Thermoleophilaceae bacterium]
MPRPEVKTVTFEIDGREVSAPEGMMLVDAAKEGDVEIPYFCYEPRLGQPVGACRMCLVEIEGMPKLQTSCSTPVKDGMVVVTTSDRVKHAQNAVVEFLLVNHPLDCPVCDKGGECPLQDISFGWGAGRSRVIEPKRHFKKPLELSPLVAIDRERCILCYRCVRFSQEVAEDHQLVFLERGDHTYVGTHHGHPYVAPFSGNIVSLCPVGALTSTAYRFRARPWDIENAGTVCTLCPAQCNVEFSVRDDKKVLRVYDARHNEGVDDGWLCDKGRFGYQTINSGDRVLTPMVREGGVFHARSWENAMERVADALKKSGAKTALIAGGETTNEEAFLAQKLMRDALGSGDMDSRAGALDAEQARVLARPDLTASVPDVEWADAVLVLETELVDEMPILELRVRKGRRRNGVQVAVASSHPSALDREAAATVRFAPGSGEALLAALAAALGSERAPGAPSDEPMPARGGDGADEPPAEPDELPHGDPVGTMGEASTEPDPGAPAPVSGPGGEPGAMAGGPPGEQSQEGEQPAAGVDKSGGDEGYAGGESAPESGAQADQGEEAAGAERGAGSSSSTGAGSESVAASGGSPRSVVDGLSSVADADAEAVQALADTLSGAGSVVIIWGERLSHGPRGKQAIDALLAVAQALKIAETEGSGLLEVPSGTNGRGLREIGLLPNSGPGFADASGRGSAEIAAALASGNSSAVVLLHADPLATHPNRRLWEDALDQATFVVAFAEFMDGGIAEHADVVLPAESYAEREGTVVHPDGRLQRLRQTVAHPGEVRPVWWQLEQILAALGQGTGARTAPMVSEQIFNAVPFYEGLTLDEIGGRGVRWQERDAASKLPDADLPDGQLDDPPTPADANGSLRLGTRPSLWTGYVTRHAPVLEFLKPEQTVELSPADAERLGIGAGSQVQVGINGTRLNATATVRASMPVGTAYLIEGTDDEPAGALLNGEPQTVEVTPG